MLFNRLTLLQQSSGWCDVCGSAVLAGNLAPVSGEGWFGCELVGRWRQVVESWQEQ